MSTSITTPAPLAPAVRNGLYEELQSTYEALDVIILTPDRENPQHAPNNSGCSTSSRRQRRRCNDEPSAPLMVSLIEHRTVLLKAIRAAARTEQCLTEELPAESPRRQQARQTITGLRRLARQIKAQDPGPEDIYLQRLVVLAVLDQRYSEGRIRAELHKDLDDFPAEQVDDAATQLATLGLLRIEGEGVHATGGLSRIDELDLIRI